MIKYTYTAKNKDGELINGQVEADSVSAASKTLTSKGFYPVDIRTSDKTAFSFFNRISLKDKAFFTRQLATTIGVGLPISQALKVISDEVTNKALSEIVNHVLRDVEGGTQLSTAFARYPNLFSKADLALVAAGETSGDLDKILKRLATNIEKDSNISRKVVSALFYPLFVLIVVLVLMLLMTFYIMPQMEDIYKSLNSELPFLTRSMIGFSNFLQKGWFLMVLFTAAIVIAAKQFVKTKKGEFLFDNLKINIPVIGSFMRKYYAGKFSRTMAGLVAAGVSILDSLDITAKAVGNVVYHDILISSISEVKNGVPLSTELKKAIEFPPIVSQMLLVGEQTGEIDTMLENLADYFDEEVDAFVKGIMGVIEPFMIVFMGGIVGVVLVAVMLPIYSLGKVI